MIAKLSRYFYKNNIIDNEELETFIYGLKLCLYKFTHLLLMLILGLVTGRILNTLVFIINFMLIRRIYGGAHAKRNSSCYIISFMMCISNILLSGFSIDKSLSLIIYILLNMLIYIICYSIKSIVIPIITIMGCIVIYVYNDFAISYVISSFYCLLLVIIEFINKKNLLILAQGTLGLGKKNIERRK